MKKQIGVLTTTRAEFGLLKPLINRLRHADFCYVSVLVTGTHLSQDFGYTYKEIESAGIPIDTKIECITEGDSPEDVSVNMSLALSGFAHHFNNHKYDLLIVLGDRYETMAVCIAAMNAEIPIAHIHGGEATEGLIDEAIRHSITKMSQLHFVCTDVYRNRVIQLGEHPSRVYNVGALAVENIVNNNYYSREQLGEELGLDLSRNYAVVTYHPVTLEENSGVDQIEQLLYAMDEFSDMSFIITKSNSDAGGRYINRLIDEYAENNNNVVTVTSLGVERYLSAVKYCSLVLGNSSSGIIEAPCLRVPTVNIGDRQKGRFMPESVLSCKANKEEIVYAINKATSKQFIEKTKKMKNYFGNGDTSKVITSILCSVFEDEGRIDIKKAFYDIEVKV